MYIYYDFTVK